ncbi:hypothetical protein IX84_19685 [Phaeodactylibacter xiamenensis]|uniref:Uncharacterized protein n=2 Tax=Phaeodactylibacter xiamenensis TaxID=1524460 RepID=A0A098S4F3_9BACT|nr:hypothetical protein IX84_19685 [Phaeodactylibacter xiamenensis]
MQVKFLFSAPAQPTQRYFSGFLCGREKLSMNNLFVVPLLLLSALGFAQSDTWEEVKSFEGRFRVLAPGTMQLAVDTMETPVGALTYYTYYYQPPAEEKSAENLMYMVSYCDYPEGSLHADSTELLAEFFETTRESGAFSINGDLIYHSERNLGDANGQYWRIDYLDGNAVLKTWALVAGRRFYSVQTATVATRSLNRSTDRFFESFVLIEAEQPAPQKP